jgi:hypothetical protein
MIVCSCNRLAATDIDRGWCDLRAGDGGRVITPGAVFRALDCRPGCGGCFPLVAKLIHQNESAYRGLPRSLEAQPLEGKLDDEGLGQGHRDPQRGATA